MYSGKGRMALYTKSLRSKISFPELNISLIYFLCISSYGGSPSRAPSVLVVVVGVLSAPSQ